MSGHDQLPPDQERAVRRVLASQPALSHPLPTSRLKRLRTIALIAPLTYGLALFPLVLYRSSAAAIRVFWVVLSLEIITSIILLILNLRERKRIQQMLAPHECFVCLFCHYPLSELPEHGQCPECGTFYNRPEVIRAWKTAYGPDKRPTRRGQTDSQVV
ncbi:MAG TPA: hypothetical protein VHC70_15380 [Phycisphaerales bacterium]|nr:hypothetical protein [Phycisphaerales bacterium]